MKIVSSFRILAAMWAVAVSLVLVPPVAAVPITGANGTKVDFAGVKAAAPDGLQVKILADGNLATVPWDKFDLAKLEAEQPEIFAAYQKAQGGETVGLYLGVFVSEKPKEEMSVPARPKRVDDFVETTVKGSAGSGFTTMRVAMKRPSPNAQAIFVAAFGQGRGGDRFSSTYIARGERSSWSDFFSANKLVPVGFEVDWKEGDPRNEPFFLTEKGSGEALLNAISTLAKQTGRDDLADAPIVIYGRGVMGSSLALNMALYKPERMLCALSMKGGSFMMTEPSAAAAKVPILILKGEYDDTQRDWELKPFIDDTGTPFDAPHEARQRYISSLPMKPNWTLVVEPRGVSDFSPVTEMLGREFIDAVIKQRFGSGEFADMVPDIAYMGNMKEKTVKNMPDGQGVLTEDETWLPDQKFASVWRQFLEGTLAPPPPPRPE